MVPGASKAGSEEAGAQLLPEQLSSKATPVGRGSEQLEPW